MKLVSLDEYILRKAIAWSILINTAIAVIFLFCLVQNEMLSLSSKSPVQLVYDNCLSKMAQQNCTFQNGPIAFPAQVKQIFVPGYGGLNADLYRTFQSLGINMCKSIQEACVEKTDSESCRLGYALYLK